MEYGIDFCVGGTATHPGGYEPASKAFDDNNATYCQNYADTFPWWVKYDLGDGIAKTAAKYTIRSSTYGPNYMPSAWVFEGSNNDTDWVELDSKTGIVWSGGAFELKEYEFTNTAAYRYYRWSFSAPADYYVIAELEAMEPLGSEIADPANYLHARRDRMNMKGVSLQNSAV